MPTKDGLVYGYERDFGAPAEYWQRAKDEAWERDHAWEIGYALQPKHPNMTGENKCWLCLKDGTDKSMRFEVEMRLGDSIMLPPEEAAAIRKRGETVPNKIKVCQFCDMKCYMEGWKAVRRDFILAGGRAKPAEGEM